MAYVCEKVLNDVCTQWVEQQSLLADFAITGEQASWLVAQIVGFWVTMFLLRELRKRLFRS